MNETPNNPYDSTRGQAAFLGRKAIFERARRALTKVTPAHVSIVGPKYLGKTALLKELCKHFQAQGDPFLAVVYWELRRDTPQTDSEFRVQLGTLIKEQVSGKDEDIFSYLCDAPDDLQEVFNEVKHKGKRMIILLDDHHEALKPPQITQNLWGYMEMLANNSAVSFVAASPEPLALMGYSEEVRTSPYWNKYDPILTLEPFDDANWDAFLQPFADRKATPDASARKEIANWTGGLPGLASSLAKDLFDHCEPGQTLSKADVDAAGRELGSNAKVNSDLRTTWGALSETAKKHFYDLRESKATPGQWAHAHRQELELRGLVPKAQGCAGGAAGTRSTCRLLDRWLDQHGAAASVLRSVFGTCSGYEANLPSVLELRLQQITGLHPDLQGSAGRAVRELAHSPADALLRMRDLFDASLRIIWHAEGIGNDRVVPVAWSQAFNTRFSYGSPLDGDRLPFHGDRGKQCHVLDFVTGSTGTAPVARVVTKATAILLQTIKSSGDFRHHLGSQGAAEVTFGFSAAACLVAVEACESITGDLRRASAAATSTGSGASSA